ncbi:MAG: DUF4332 domain-containing protein [Caldilineaceae bacterium]
MAGVDFLSFQGLWLVLAGFILGFAASTLWEWLYYRSKRQVQGGQAPATTLYAPRTDTPHGDLHESASDESDPTWAFSYRSPGVYLESEQTERVDPTEMVLESPTKVIIAPPPEPIVTSPPQVDPKPPRLNPATLAAIQTAVALAPVAQPTTPSALLPIATMTEESARQNLHAPATLPDAESGDRTERNTRPVNGVETERYRATLVAPTAAVTVPASAPHPSAPPVTPPATAEPSPDHPDNLAMIRGVGEAYKRRLYGVGIYTWRQVAESDIETLRRITRAKPNADINGWRTQARELAEKYQRWQTTFRGPLDDFTRIDGIGAITADLLYKAGICTYDQLAGALPDELAKIVPAPTVGDENDFAGWIKEAGRLANVKRRNEGLLA